MKKILISLLILYFTGYSYAQKGVVNNGAKITISNGALLNIEGSEGNYINKSYDASSHGKIDLNGKLKLQGNWGNYANSGYVFVNADDTGQVIFNGTTQQLLGGTNQTIFENLEINKTGTLRLLKSSGLSDTLFLTSGLLNLKDYHFLIDSTALIWGTPSVSNMIIANDDGSLRKYFSKTGSFTFPIGDTVGTANEYAPLELTFNSATFGAGAYVQAKIINAKHPNNSSSTHFINRYWQIESYNITDIDADIAATYTTADLNTGANEASLYAAKYASPYWTVYGAANVTANTISANVSSFSDFTGGEDGALSPYITLSDNGITEGNENGRVITVMLYNDDFVSTLNTSNWKVKNLPSNVSVGSITRTGNKTVNITLNGNRNIDFDSNILNVEVMVDSTELVNLSHGTIRKNTGVVIVAIDDDESITMTDDGIITEGAEDGEVITITVNGGTVAESFESGLWNLTGLPSGVSYAEPVRFNENTVKITLSGSGSYDADITDATITVPADQVDDYEGAEFSVSTGITFSYVDESFTITIQNQSTITEGVEGSGVFEVIINKTFVSPLTLSRWTAYNLPQGVTLAGVNYVDANNATITLNGPSTKDYDTNIENVSFQILSDEFSDHSDNVSTETDIVFTAVDEGDEALGFTIKSISEALENGQVITVNLVNGTFANSIDSTQWTVTNLPEGVSVSRYKRISSTAVELILSGNRRVDYDSDITNFTVSVDPSQVDDYEGVGDLSISSGITFAHNVAEPAESIVLADDADAISEGEEDGEVITVTLLGGTFVQTLTPAGWSISNQPTGVSIGSIELIDSVTVKLTLDGNTSVDYDVNILNFTVTVPESDIDEHTGSDISANTNVLFIADDEEVVLKIEDDIIKEGSEDGEIITLTLQEDEFVSSVSLPLFENYYQVSNLPTGVSKGAVTWVNADTVTITLSGDRTQDFDSDIENVTVSLLAGALVQHVSSTPFQSSGVIIDAVNDGELLVLSDTSIIEGSEDGEAIFIEIEGGTFMPAITGDTWQVLGLPAGVSKGAFTRVDDTLATIVLSGNASVDYDIDIENVTITVPGTDVNDYDELTISRSTGITLQAIVEPIVLTIENDIDGIDEASENGEIILVTIENDEFIPTIVPSNWSFTGLPQGVSIESVTQTSATTASIVLSGNRTKDYDADITSAELTIKGNQFVVQSSDVSNTGITFTANNDDESISLADDGFIMEGSEGDEKITVTVNGGTFASTLAKANWSISNQPSGVSIGTLTKKTSNTVEMVLLGDATADYDADINNLTLSIADSEIDEYSGANLEVGTGVTFTAIEESLTISSTETLNEMNLDGAELLLELSDEIFYNSTFDTANITLNNAPDTLRIRSITYLSSTQARLVLEFVDTVDFDSNMDNFSITIAENELLGLGSVTSNNLSIVAVNEAVAISISDDGINEAAENGELITVTVSVDEFVASLTPSNWLLTGLPQGVGKGNVIRVNSTTVSIQLSGNRLTDFDSNIDNIQLTVKAGEFVGSIIDKASVDSVSILANNDDETLTLGDTGIGEGAEDGEIIKVKLNGGTFINEIDISNWYVSGLPNGVTVDTIIKISSDSANIVLTGNALYDYDNNITNIEVGISEAEIDEHSGGSISQNTGVTFVANNDPEIITMASDGSIIEGAEDGEVITVSISGGNFVDPLNEQSWSFNNLPIGMQVNQINRIHDYSVGLVLSGNRTADYDNNITEFSVSIAKDQIDDNTETDITVDAGVIFTANYEMGQLVHAGLTEENLDGAIVTINLLNETFADATIADSNFILHNIPNGLSITSVTYNSTTQAELALSFDGTDFDTNLVNFYLEIHPLEVAGIATVYSDSLTITAVNDEETITLTDDGAILEGAEDAEQITVTLNGGTFVDVLNINNWTFTNLPTGVAVASVIRTSATTATLTLSGNTTNDYDTDIDNFTASILFNELNDFNSGSILASTGVTFMAVQESLSITADALSESNLNGANITLSLSNEMFVDNVLDKSNFELNNIPPGISINTVTYNSETTALISLAYDGTDFDADSNNVSVTILPIEIVGVGALTSNTIGIASYIESQTATISHVGLSETNLNGASLTLTLGDETFVSTSPDVLSFSLNSAPVGTSVAEVNYINDSVVSIVLAFDGTDFDLDLSFNISVSAAELSLGSGITSNNLTITAINDEETFVLSYDGYIEEGAEDGEKLTLQMKGGDFASLLTPLNWSFVNAPEGLSIGKLTIINDTAVEISIAGNAIADYDENILNFGIALNEAEVNDYSGNNIIIDTGVVLTAIIEPDPKLLKISSTNTDEYSLNGGVIHATVSGDYFIDSTISLKSILLHNEPIGLSISEVIYIDSVTLRLRMAHNYSDFDEDYENVYVSIQGLEFNGSKTLYSDTLVFTAIIEPETIKLSHGNLSENNLNGSQITLLVVGDQFEDSNLLLANFILDNAPDSTSITSVEFINDTAATITLAYKHFDFDFDVNNFGVVVMGDEFWSSNSIRSENTTIAAINDPEILSMYDDGYINERSAEGEIITVNLSGGYFSLNLDINSWSFANIPDQLIINSLTRINDTTVNIELATTGIIDIDANLNLILSVGASQVNDHEESDLTCSVGAIIIAVDEQLQANITDAKENGLAESVIHLKLINDNFADAALVLENFNVEGLAGLIIDSVKYLSDTTASLYLGFNQQDFDENQSITIQISGKELVYSDTISSNSIELIAINDDEVFTLADDGEIIEGSENGEIITLNLTGGTFVELLNTTTWIFENLPIGVVVDSISLESDTLVYLYLKGNATMDYDTNLTQFTVIIPDTEFNDYFGASVPVKGGVTFIAKQEEGNLTISSHELAENNLNGSVVELELVGATFVSESKRNLSAITLNNAPDGLTASTFNILSDTTAQITLAYLGFDFDIDYPNFSVIVESSILNPAVSLTSNALLIRAIVEPEVIVDFDGEILEGYESGEILEVSLLKGKYKPEISLDSINFTEFPTGVSLTNLVRMSDTLISFELNGNRTIDYDEDLSGVNGYLEDGIFESYLGKVIEVGTPIVFKGFNEKLEVSSEPLNEGNLNGAILKLMLKDDIFTDSELDMSYVSLHNDPIGLSIAALTYQNDTSALLELAYDGTAMNSTIDNFFVELDASELHGIENLQSNELQIGKGVGVGDHFAWNVKIYSKFATVIVAVENFNRGWEKANISVFDASGKIVNQTALLQQKRNKVHLNVLDGFYFVKVNIDGIDFVGKVFILPD